MQITKIITVFILISTIIFAQDSPKENYLFKIKTLGDISNLERHIEFGYINKNFSFPEIKSLNTIRFYQYYQTGKQANVGPG